MLDCVTNKCGREEREGKINDSINNLRTREALDYEFESKRNGPAFGRKRARNDLAAEKYVVVFDICIFSNLLFTRGLRLIEVVIKTIFLITLFPSSDLTCIQGGIPYPGISNRELLRLLKSGYRMEKPAICSDEL